MPLYTEPGQLYTEPGVYYTSAPVVVTPFEPDGWTVDSTFGSLFPQPVVFLIYDLVDQTIVDAVPFSTHTFNRSVSTPGGWSATIAHDHPKATHQTLDANRMACFVTIEDVLHFGGMLRQPSVSLDENLAGDSLTVGGDGIFGYFRGDGSETGRFLNEAKHYNDVPAIDIVEDLIGWAQDVAGGDIGMAVVKVGTGPDIDLFLRGFELNNIGTTIERVCEENDIEWDVDYTWDRNVTPPRPVATLTLTQGMRGVRKNLDLVLGKNIKMLSYTADGFRQANQVHAVGAGDGRNMLRTLAAEPSMITPAGQYPLLERVVTDKTITRRFRLGQFANAKLRKSRNPARTATVELLSDGPVSEEVPFGSWTTGDQVRLFAEDGFIHETGEWWRILGYEVAHDVDQNRSVRLDMASMAEFE